VSGQNAASQLLFYVTNTGIELKQFVFISL